MKNEILTIGPFTIYGYGLMIAIGIIAAYITVEYRARKQGLAGDQILYLALWCVLGGFVASKILFWITEWRNIVEDPAFLLDTLQDGFVVYGGIAGGVAAGYLFCRIRKLPFLKYFDLVIPSIALAQGFGRIGCLLAGCCYGIKTDSICSIVFHESEFAPNGVPLVPTQIYSSLLDFLHFIILLVVSAHKKEDGQVAACYLIFYSIGRFFMEFLRGDLERGNVGVLSTSQFISVFTGAAGLALLIFLRKKGMQNRKKS